MRYYKVSLLAAALGLGLLPVSARGQGIGDVLRLLRPEVLRQLNGDVVRLVNFLPQVDGQNRAIVGRLFAHGGLGHAKLGKDGVYRLLIRVPSGQFIWRPAIIVMGHAGDLELDISNEDEFSHHAAILPSNGGRVFMILPQYERRRARLHLDAPGYYWFGCPVANHAGRGMLGLILVLGDVPDEAKLDRPKNLRLPTPSARSSREDTSHGRLTSLPAAYGSTAFAFGSFTPGTEAWQPAGISLNPDGAALSCLFCRQGERAARRAKPHRRAAR